MEEGEYRKLAAVEDRMWYFAALHALIDRELTGFLGEQPAELLDAGCGTGGLICRSGQLHPSWRWTGVDVSPLAVRLARERWSTGSGALTSASSEDRGIAGSSSGTPFGVSGPDRGQCTKALKASATQSNRNENARPPVILEASLTSLPFPAARFDAIVSADVLYHIANDNAALRELRRVLRPGGTLILNVPAHPWLWSYHDEAVGGLRRYRRGDLRRQLLAAGFATARLTHWNALLLPLIAARRKLFPPPKHGSDVQEFSPPLELLGRGATALERAWLRLAPLPFGSSLLAIAS